MLPTVCMDACTTTFFLQVVSCGPIFCVLRNSEKDPTEQLFICKFLCVKKRSNGTTVPLQKGSLARDIPSVLETDLLAAFALLVPASLPSSS